MMRNRLPQLLLLLLLEATPEGDEDAGYDDKK
jgi:hypothetical protein